MISVWHQSTTRAIRMHLLSYRSRCTFVISFCDHSARRRFKSNIPNIKTILCSKAHTWVKVKKPNKLGYFMIKLLANAIWLYTAFLRTQSTVLLPCQLFGLGGQCFEGFFCFNIGLNYLLKLCLLGGKSNFTSNVSYWDEWGGAESHGNGARPGE